MRVDCPRVPSAPVTLKLRVQRPAGRAMPPVAAPFSSLLIVDVTSPPAVSVAAMAIATFGAVTSEIGTSPFSTARFGAGCETVISGATLSGSATRKTRSAVLLDSPPVPGFTAWATTSVRPVPSGTRRLHRPLSSASVVSCAPALVSMMMLARESAVPFNSYVKVPASRLLIASIGNVIEIAGGRTKRRSCNTMNPLIANTEIPSPPMASNPRVERMTPGRSAITRSIVAAGLLGDSRFGRLSDGVPCHPAATVLGSSPRYVA